MCVCVCAHFFKELQGLKVESGTEGRNSMDGTSLKLMGFLPKANSRSENDVLGEASKTCSLKPRLEAKLVSESPKCHFCTP